MTDHTQSLLNSKLVKKNLCQADASTSCEASSSPKAAPLQSGDLSAAEFNDLVDSLVDPECNCGGRCQACRASDLLIAQRAELASLRSELSTLKEAKGESLRDRALASEAPTGLQPSAVDPFREAEPVLPWQPMETALKDGKPILIEFMGADGRPMHGIVHWGCPTHWHLSSWHPSRCADCEKGWMGGLGMIFTAEPLRWFSLRSGTSEKDRNTKCGDFLGSVEDEGLVCEANSPETTFISLGEAANNVLNSIQEKPND